MTEPTYEGWSNRATWNANLWVFNEYPFYLAWKEANAQACGKWSVESARSFCTEQFGGDCTPDGEKLTEVNWSEIAEDWAESGAEELCAPAREGRGDF